MSKPRDYLTAPRLSREELAEKVAPEHIPGEDEPEALVPLTLQEKPNEPIEIYDGDIGLHIADRKLRFVGKIFYSWFPFPAARFAASAPEDIPDIKVLLSSNTHCDLHTPSGPRGKVKITYFSIGLAPSYLQIGGTFDTTCVVGDNSIKVSEIRFAIPNFISYMGQPVWAAWGSHIQRLLSRLQLPLGNYCVDIDQFYPSIEYQKKLSASGGYYIMHTARLRHSNNKAIAYAELANVMLVLSRFISWTSGRYTSPLFWIGLHENETHWATYSPQRIAPYKAVKTWFVGDDVNCLQLLSKRFYAAHQDESNAQFWGDLIHWYMEANTHSGLIDGAIIFAQTALELLYNYWIVEKLNLIRGRDADSLSASNKIRLIVSQLSLDSNVPENLTQLSSFIQDDRELSDGPDAIVFLRNSLVHGNLSKRKKYAQLPDGVAYQSFILALHYVELAMLKLLNYNGLYFDRCELSNMPSKAEKQVPWSLVNETHTELD